MIILVKITIILIMITLLLLFCFKGWVRNNPLQANLEYYPAWAYLMGFLIIVDVICIFVIVIWFLFFKC